MPNSRIKVGLVQNSCSLDVEANTAAAIRGVREAAAIGLPDPRWGETIAVCVVTQESEAEMEQAILQNCRARLANYKIPKRLIFVDSIPKNSMGKALKRELKLQFAPTTSG